MKRTAFDLFHPVVAFGYFAVMFALSMTAMQPVYLAISLASVLSYSAVLCGWRATGRSLLWQLPLVAVVALANPLFSASGSTELFRLGLRAFYLESFVYGACMGIMLISVIVLFSNASQVLTSDKVMTLFGGVAPTIGLMLSMTARPAEEPAGKLAVMRGYLRRTSVLMGWGMEDSLETAGAMKARGWGAAARRTTYARYRFRRFDAAALVFGGALALLAAAAAWAACAQFRFYPTIGGLAPWWNYLPYALFACLPLAITAKEHLRWRA